MNKITRKGGYHESVADGWVARPRLCVGVDSALHAHAKPWARHPGKCGLPGRYNVRAVLRRTFPDPFTVLGASMNTLLAWPLRLALLLSLVSLHASAADWPQWRGPQRDGKSAETGLLKEWPQEGPKL